MGASFVRQAAGLVAWTEKSRHCAGYLGPRQGGRPGRGRSAETPGDVPKIVDWYMENKINIDDLITHTLPLERINEGFELMKSGQSIRSVVLY